MASRSDRMTMSIQRMEAASNLNTVQHRKAIEGRKVALKTIRMPQSEIVRNGVSNLKFKSLCETNGNIVIN